MIKNIDIFLKEIANEEKLKENTISLVFAINPNINISDRVKFFDNVIPFYNEWKNKERPLFEVDLESKLDNEIEQWYGKDLRIKKVKLKSVRGIPDREIPFSINLCNESDQPQSLIILGGNASGKSSIYSAIEYCYCQRIGEAELRLPPNYECDDNDDWFITYLRNFNNDFNKCLCEITTNTEGTNFSIKEQNNIPAYIRSKINPNTHFISDFDIYSKGQLKYNIDEPGDSERYTFQNTIAGNLGLSNLLDFDKNLKSFLYYSRRTESNKLAAFQKENSTTSANIEATKKVLIEKKAQLIDLNKNQGEIPENQRSQKKIETINLLKQNILSFNFDHHQFIEVLEKYLQVDKQYKAISIKSGSINELQFLTYGLELLLNSENCPLCTNSKDNSSIIKLNVQSRINKIKELNIITQDLNQSFNNATDLIKKLEYQITSLINKTNGEIELIKNDADLNELLVLLNKFFTFSSEFYGGDFINRSRSFENNQNFIVNKLSFISDLISENLTFLKTDLKVFINSIKPFIEQRESLLKSIESRIIDNTHKQSLVEQIVRIKQEISIAEKTIIDSEGRIKTNNSEIEKLQNHLALYETIKQETAQFQDVLNIKLSEEVNKAFAPLKLVVEEILEYYFNEIDDRQVRIVLKKEPDKIDEETGQVLSEIIVAYAVLNDEDRGTLPIKKYLNTFHYRLFSTMVGIGVAIASRLNTGINLPLVLDDIFYASDFQNRATVENFIKELFNIFKRYTPDKELQLILFTHDELIFESIIKTCVENKIENIRFNKLFRPSEAVKGQESAHLLYSLPNNISLSLTKKVF
jgi:hypothetical protein